jgi:hypothetical protein
MVSLISVSAPMACITFLSKVPTNWNSLQPPWPRYEGKHRSNVCRDRQDTRRAAYPQNQTTVMSIHMHRKMRTAVDEQGIGTQIEKVIGSEWK